MSVNVAPRRIAIDDFRVMLQIVSSLTDDSRGVIYNCILAFVLNFCRNISLQNFLGHFFQPNLKPWVPATFIRFSPLLIKSLISFNFNQAII